MGRSIEKPLDQRNRGAVLLLLTRLSDQRIADRLACSISAPGHWKSGKRKPSVDLRVLLEHFFAIPRESWDEPATVEDIPVSHRSRFGRFRLLLRAVNTQPPSQALPAPSPLHAKQPKRGAL